MKKNFIVAPVIITFNTYKNLIKKKDAAYSQMDESKIYILVITYNSNKTEGFSSVLCFSIPQFLKEKVGPIKVCPHSKIISHC